MSAILLLRTTFGDAASADRVARQIIAERLAACVTLSSGQSIYRWNGAIEQAEEIVALFKTRPDRGAALSARIAELHDYDLPVIESWAAEVDAEVAKWIDDDALSVPQVS